MKTSKLFLPSLAFAISIATGFASSHSEEDSSVARGISQWNQACPLQQLDDGRVRGTATGQCDTQDDLNGVCTVTFIGELPTYAYGPRTPCSSIFVLFIQD